MPTFPSNAAQEKLVGDFATAITHMTVGFLKFTRHAGDDDVEPAGTGTLVSVGPHYGVLTASHVLQELHNQEEVGLLRFRVGSGPAQKARIEMRHAEKLMLGGPPYGPLGPDLGFLRLPENLASALRATNVFFNLEKAKEATLSSPNSEPHLDALVGIVAEKTRVLPPPTSNTLVKGVEAIFSAGKIVREYSASGFDLLDFDLLLSPDVERPESYQGMSGGGLWRLRLDPTLHQTLGRALIGVAFYESEVMNSRRLLTCHGKAAVYNEIIARVRAEWPY